MTDVVERPSIDPRIAQRWVDVHRELGLRRLRVLVVVAAVVALVVAGVGSLYTPVWRVRHVDLTTSGALSPSRIAAVAGVDRRMLMINVDTSAITRRLDSDPYLGGARVVEQWPATLHIAVGQRTALAQVQMSGGAGWAVVDVTGRVLEDVAARVLGMPVLIGVPNPPAPGGWLAGSLGPKVAPGSAPSAEVDLDAVSDSPDTPKGVAAALVAIQALPAGVAPDLISVSVTADGGVTMQVLPLDLAAGSIDVVLGDGSQLGAKLTSLATLLAQADLNGVTSIDLTVPDRPAALTAR